MTMLFESIQTAGIAQLSYLVGDDGTQTAAVIDPRPDVEVYLELARKHEWRLRIFSRRTFTPIS
ncbi:hypothetical protein [Aeoliella sp.]|uniref:hypothetical protein n=1 Tax=Aeoliella sp. TaxID=2795800 RepID=UPI003CCB7CB8